MKTFLVTGGTSGLGRRVVERLTTDPNNFVYVVGLEPEWQLTALPDWQKRYKYASIDLSTNDQRQIQFQLQQMVGDTTRLDVLINCAGINAIDWLPNLDQQTLDRVMSVNVNSLLYVTQALLSRLQGHGTIVNVVSNAYRMPMTHSWIYNASKGAAAIATRQMARELQKTHNICVFGICPNKMSGTQMSQYIDERVCELRGWTAAEAAAYQLNGLVPGFETDPDWIAELLVWLLELPHRHKYLSGCLLETGY